jgi:polyhydroxyalkanoate synthesis regulator phasin
MKPDAAFEFLQNSFRISLGASAFVVETLQDDQKREDNLRKLSSDWGQLAQEWADKGAVAEQEARNMVEQLFHSSTPPTSGAPKAPTPGVNTEVQTELLDLTQQIIALRAELQKYYKPDVTSN